MSEAHHKLIETIFDEVVDLPQGQRAAVLRDRCAADENLIHRIEQLLAADAANAGRSKIASVADFRETPVDRAPSNSPR